MLLRYAVCTEKQGKPVTHRVCTSKPLAEKLLEELKVSEAHNPEEYYWIAEVGADAEVWSKFESDRDDL